MNGSIFDGLRSSLSAFMYQSPAIILIIIFILFCYPYLSYDKKWGIKNFLIISALVCFLLNIVYLFSFLIMNYAMRFFYPTFTIMFLVSGITLSYLYYNYPKNKAISNYLLKLFIYSLVLIMIISNLHFAPAILTQKEYAQGLQNGHIRIGNILSNSCYQNLTIASEESGAIPYYSKLRHIDMLGLNDVNIALNGKASSNYIYQNPPSLLFFNSVDGNNIIKKDWEQVFLHYAIENHFIKLPAIKIQYDQYLIPYIDPKVDSYTNFSMNYLS